ncbi:hypothetical protein [Anaerocaecibacter muris]|uniref:hypothetical protein n=1 Tax=Anaerocaecibacter muris TaxID=2941513 RepID=UPI003F68F04C
MKISTRSITLAATLTAMCFVTGLLPYVFFLPVTVAATTLSVGIAAFVGFAFGAVSVAYSFLVPTGSFVGVAFMQAPYVAIIPRVLAALGAFGAYKLIEHIAKPQKRAAKFAAVSASAATGSLLNTALVVSMFVLILPSLTAGGATLAVAVPQMLISGAIECVCMAAITPPITLTLNKVVLRGKDLRNRHVPQTPEVSDK